MEVANKKIPLTIGVWVKDISQAAGQLIGQVIFSLPPIGLVPFLRAILQFVIQVSALYDQKPLEQFFKLRKPGVSEEEDKSFGELKVKLLFTEVDVFIYPSHLAFPFSLSPLLPCLLSFKHHPVPKGPFSFISSFLSFPFPPQLFFRSRNIPII